MLGDCGKASKDVSCASLMVSFEDLRNQYVYSYKTKNQLASIHEMLYLLAILADPVPDSFGANLAKGLLIAFLVASLSSLASRWHSRRCAITLGAILEVSCLNSGVPTKSWLSCAIESKPHA